MKMLAVALAVMSTVACSGPKFALGSGTQFCTPTRYEAGTGVVDANTGAPFRWTIRTRATRATMIELDWGEHRDLKDRMCAGKKHYLVEPWVEVCIDDTGKAVSTKLVRASVSPSFDRRVVKAMLETRYCPVPTDMPEIPLCRTTRFKFHATCD